ncbi:MAG: 2-oxoacid:acceptor oxidoreductase family protein [Bryobacterales bacterium]|nr:2-oxoacid:acceptor oxidoreductase family protein [Bryobacterales bacterium]
MPEYRPVQERSRSFFPLFERKPDNQNATHYCPGCGHGIVHKLIARAIDDLGIQDRAILISPVGCSVFAYFYFDTGNVQVAHGRAPAVATAIKRARPDAIVISYQGDGDLAAIGTAEILHAAARDENFTTIFINNAIYGMTGGQLAPTSMVGQKSTTTPAGRSIWNEGYPLHVCEVLNTLDGPAYIERVALGDNKMILYAAKAIRAAIQAQMDRRGFSFVEVLSPCPTVWGKDPVAAQQWVRDEMTKVYPLGVIRDRDPWTHPIPVPPPPFAFPSGAPPLLAKPDEPVDYRIKVAGFGGQGVLLLGELLAEAGLQAGLSVSWLPSYGPEMRSGTSHCHVRLSSEEVDSPLVTNPNVLIALNEPSLRKFLHTVEPGGWVFFNGDAIPADCARADVRAVALPMTSLAVQTAGDAKATNMVMLGVVQQALHLLPAAAVDQAMHSLIHSERWLAIDHMALNAGSHRYQERCHV